MSEFRRNTPQTIKEQIDACLTGPCSKESFIKLRSLWNIYVGNPKPSGSMREQRPEVTLKQAETQRNGEWVNVPLNIISSKKGKSALVLRAYNRIRYTLKVFPAEERKKLEEQLNKKLTRRRDGAFFFFTTKTDRLMFNFSFEDQQIHGLAHTLPELVSPLTIRKRSEESIRREEPRLKRYKIEL